MANTIRHKRSSVTEKVPLANDLVQGELAINTTDVKLYTKKTDNTVVAVNDWENIHNKPDFDAEYVSYDLMTVSENPDTDDVPANTWGIFRNTGSGNVEIWANNGGTMVRVVLTTP